MDRPPGGIAPGVLKPNLLPELRVVDAAAEQHQGQCSETASLLQAARLAGFSQVVVERLAAAGEAVVDPQYEHTLDVMSIT